MIAIIAADVIKAELEEFPIQAHGDPPRLRIFGPRTWKQLQNYRRAISASVRPERSGGRAEAEIGGRAPSSLDWELAWKRRS